MNARASSQLLDANGRANSAALLRATDDLFTLLPGFLVTNSTNLRLTCRDDNILYTGLYSTKA
jgi:hypothetical protein